VTPTAPPRPDAACHATIVEAARRHLPTLDALRVRDPERAATAMHDHLSEVADRLRPLTTNKEIW
jgi:DNA-binding GntR family transcriptional regulator